MKTLSTISPIIVGLLCAGWLASGEYDRKTAGEEGDLLRQRIVKAKATLELERDRNSLFIKTNGKEERPNWNLIFSRINQEDHSVVAELDEWSDGLSKNALIDLITELRRDGSHREKGSGAMNYMKLILYGRLRKIDPQACLEVGTIGGLDSDFISFAPSCLERWIERDPVAAMGWYDGKLADGMLDSKSLNGFSKERELFEKMLFSHFITENPAEAERRALNLSKVTRDSVIENAAISPLDAKSKVELARMIRRIYPSAEASSKIIMMVSRDSWSSKQPFQSTLEIINQSQLSPQERRKAFLESGPNLASVVTQKQKKSAEDALNQVRDWVGGSSPEYAEDVMGRSLGQLVHDKQMEGAAAIGYAERMIANGGNSDELIIAIFDRSGSPPGDREQWRALASRISDPAKKDEILKKLK